jgi:hypothetical protein
MITHDLSESTASAPYTSAQIFMLLKNEQRILAADEKRQGITLAAQTQALKTPQNCANCKK